LIEGQFEIFFRAMKKESDHTETHHRILLIEENKRERRRRMEAESELALLSEVVESTLEGVMITDQNGVIISTNAALLEMTGYSGDELIGKKPDIFKSYRHGDDFYRKMRQSLGESGRWHGEIWNRRKNGKIHPVRLTITGIKDAEGRTTRYASVYCDMTHIKQNEEEVSHKATHDDLTGLPNRLLFYDRLSQVINSAKRTKRPFALLYIDLDHFKNINDSMGHSTGDILLQEMALRLTACVLEGNTVSRLGGDEFTIILDCLEQESDQEADAAELAEKVLKALSAPFHLRGETIYSSVSIGIALYPANGKTVEMLLRNADMAMYHAKDIGGRNSYRFYTRALNEKIHKRVELENALRKAMAQRTLVAYYQPIYSLKNSQVVGMEALVRWPQNSGKLVLPDKFIPLAEEKGFIVDIDMFMIQKACAFIRKIIEVPPKSYPQPKHISVNLSAVDFGSLNLVHHLTETVRSFGLEPGNIGVEITESAIIKDISSAIQNLKKLRNLGFSVSMDDFGMGYSSLSYLAKLPINILKIDRSFIVDLPSDQNYNAIAKAIVFMAHEMGIEVIAEGVETEAQLDYLRSIGCDQIQGYIYSHPLPESKIEELLFKSRAMTMLGHVQKQA